MIPTVERLEHCENTARVAADIRVVEVNIGRFIELATKEFVMIIACRRARHMNVDPVVGQLEAVCGERKVQSPHDTEGWETGRDYTQQLDDPIDRASGLADSGRSQHAHATMSVCASMHWRLTPKVDFAIVLNVLQHSDVARAQKEARRQL